MSFIGIKNLTSGYESGNGNIFENLTLTLNCSVGKDRSLPLYNRRGRQLHRRIITEQSF